MLYSMYFIEFFIYKIFLYILNTLKYYKIYLKRKFHISFYLKIFQSIKNNLIVTRKITKLRSRIH